VAAALQVGSGNGSSTFSGALTDGSGALSLVKVGSGSLSLLGPSSYSGGTFLNQGSLILGNSGALGSGALTMDANTTLGFTIPNMTLANPIVLSTRLDPTIDTGAGFITLAGQLSGNGDLTKIGAGALVLTGANIYTGTTFLNQGVLQVDGSIASPVTYVASGATLSGVGTVGGVTVQSGGVLAPGNAANPVATLRATGNVTFQPGAVYSLALTPSGSSLISVNGTANVAGAVAASWSGGVPTYGARYTILTATGGVNGTFGSISTTGTTALPILTYDANDVYLQFPNFDRGVIQASLQKLADDRQGLMITNRVLAGILGGFNEQINCANCVSAFGAIGSFTGGVHGRMSINNDLSVLAGAAWTSYRSNGAEVTSSPLFAIALRYDQTEWGRSRPFAEIGATASPWQRVSYARPYQAFGVASSGHGQGDASDYSTFAKLGWVHRWTQIDEAAIYGELSHNWLNNGGYSENAIANPAVATMSSGVDMMNIAKIGAQWTHLFDARIETQINGGVAHSFGSSNSVGAFFPTLGAFNISLAEQTWIEYGARVGYRLGDGLVADAFVDGTLASATTAIGSTIHGGVGLRYAF
jgi:autotransporter-associated beta strand protein